MFQGDKEIDTTTYLVKISIFFEQKCWIDYHISIKLLPKDKLGLYFLFNCPFNMLGFIPECELWFFAFIENGQN